MPWCALLAAVKNYNKSLEKLQDFLKDQDQMLKAKPSWSKTKTFIFALKAPRDQDPGLKDYITGSDDLEWSLTWVSKSLYTKKTVHILATN